MVATQIFFMFIPLWGRFPFWLIFFRWVERLKPPTSHGILHMMPLLLSIQAPGWLDLGRVTSQWNHLLRGYLAYHATWRWPIRPPVVLHWPGKNLKIQAAKQKNGWMGGDGTVVQKSCTSWNVEKLVNNGNKLPTSTGFHAGFLKHQQSGRPMISSKCQLCFGSNNKKDENFCVWWWLRLVFGLDGQLCICEKRFVSVLQNRNVYMRKSHGEFEQILNIIDDWTFVFFSSVLRKGACWYKKILPTKQQPQTNTELFEKKQLHPRSLEESTYSKALVDLPMGIPGILPGIYHPPFKGLAQRLKPLETGRNRTTVVFCWAWYKSMGQPPPRGFACEGFLSHSRLRKGFDVHQGDIILLKQWKFALYGGKTYLCIFQIEGLPINAHLCSLTSLQEGPEQTVIWMML